MGETNYPLLVFPEPASQHKLGGLAVAAGLRFPMPRAKRCAWNRSSSVSRMPWTGRAYNGCKLKLAKITGQDIEDFQLSDEHIIEQFVYSEEQGKEEISDAE